MCSESDGKCGTELKVDGRIRRIELVRRTTLMLRMDIEKRSEKESGVVISVINSRTNRKDCGRFFIDGRLDPVLWHFYHGFDEVPYLLPTPIADRGIIGSGSSMKLAVRLTGYITL